MSKVKLLLEVISDVRALAESLQAVADAMMENEPVQKEVVTETKTTKKEYTFEEVRGILAEKSQKGLTAQVKLLLEKYGVNRLSDIDPSEYEDIVKEAEEF